MQWLREEGEQKKLFPREGQRSERRAGETSEGSRRRQSCQTEPHRKGEAGRRGECCREGRARGGRGGTIGIGDGTAVGSLLPPV